MFDDDPDDNDPYYLDYCVYCTARMRAIDPTWPFCSKRCTVASESEDDADATFYERMVP